MSLVKVFCMTKDEYDLIEDFIIYYAYLFGYENIIIIDNESTNKEVLRIYEKYLKLGITLYTESSYEGNNQGIIFTKYMNIHKETCKYLIGLDTDEFLFSYNHFLNGDDFCKKENILSVFNTYEINDTLFSINSYPCSIVDPTNINYINQKMNYPARNITHFSNELQLSDKISTKWNTVSKFFSKSDSFLSASPGNHIVKVNYGHIRNSDFGLLHFNSTGKRREYERAKNVINGYKYFSTSLDINQQIDFIINIPPNCNGNHKVNSYYIFLLRTFIIDLFVKYIKRLPSYTELNMHINLNININSSIIEDQFKNCSEKIKNNDIKFNPDEKSINNLIFYDKKINNLPIEYNIIKIDSLQKVLNNFIIN